MLKLLIFGLLVLAVSAQLPSLPPVPQLNPFDNYRFVEACVIGADIDGWFDEQYTMFRNLGYILMQNATFSTKVIGGNYYNFFVVEANNNEIAVNCSLKASYSLVPTSSGQLAVGVEIISPFADPDFEESSPYRYPGLTAGNVHPDVEDWLVDNYGEINNPVTGIDYCGQVIYVANHGNGMGETQFYINPGFTGSNAFLYLKQQGCKLSHYLEAWNSQFGLKLVKTSFFQCKALLVETAEFFVTTSKRSDQISRSDMDAFVSRLPQYERHKYAAYLYSQVE